MSGHFYPADILLPDFSQVNPETWAVVACDQFTSQPDYWEEVKKICNGKKTALDLILPEAWLNVQDAKIAEINRNMKEYSNEVLKVHPHCMTYVERTQSNGRVRRGIVGMIDLEDYDYRKGSNSPIRATEGTVLERIPPRVKIRRGAALELPHVMLLIDDPENTVFSELEACSGRLEIAYDTDLMLGGGHIVGRYMDEYACGRVEASLAQLVDADVQRAKYGELKAPLLFAIGDGNHSLASAKVLYEEVKEKLGDAALNHPSRYALCEVVNLHDQALEFEPIYRVLFNVNPEDVEKAFREYAGNLIGSSEPQEITFLTADGQAGIAVKKPELQLSVGTVQQFIDGYLKAHPEAAVDYIHGEDSVRSLIGEKSVGFLFDGMKKEQLFTTVIRDGALPKKTFSMGQARDKRYYMEARSLL